MISSKSHLYLFVNLLGSGSAVQEKIQYWDSRKVKSISLPGMLFVIEEDHHLLFMSQETGELIQRMPLDGLVSELDEVTVSLRDGHEVKVLRPLGIPAAHHDDTPTVKGAVSGAALGVFLYEGNGEHLDRFEKVEKVWKSTDLRIEVEEGAVVVTPNESAGLTANGKNFNSPARIRFQDLPIFEIRSGSEWWRIGYFPNPVILDESEVEEVDPAEQRQDSMFKGITVSAFVMGLILVGWIANQQPKTDDRPVLDSAEIKIDRDNLNAKSLQEDLPKAVAIATPTPTPTPVEAAPVVQEERVAREPVAKEPVKETPKQIVKAPPRMPVKVFTPAPQAPQVPQTPRVDPAVAAAAAAAAAAQAKASANAALLSRHSQMLQDAFGSVMAMKPGAPAAVGAAGGPAPQSAGVNGAALGKGSGFFNTGATRSVASAGPEGGVAGGLVKSANPQQFVNVDSGGPLGAQAGVSGYAAGSGRIQVSGQGSGAAGVSMGSAGGSSNSLSHSEVAAVFQKHVTEIRMCYESAMLTQSDLQGTLSLAFDILPSGAVSGARVKDSDFGKRRPASTSDKTLTDCLLKRVASWTFPRPRDGKKVEITSYPLVFKSLGNGNE